MITHTSQNNNSTPGPGRRSVGRFVALVFAAIATFYFVFWCPIWSVPPLRRLPGFSRPFVPGLVAALCAFLVGRLIWKGRASTGAPGLARCIGLGAIGAGILGSSAGFFGPLIFTPGANQGPLLGILVTGPLGLITGAVGGGIFWAVRGRNNGSRGLLLAMAATASAASAPLAAPATAQEYKIAFVSARNGVAGVYVMNSDGAQVKRLTDDKGAALGSGSWSPDGQRIAFFAIRDADKATAEKYGCVGCLPLYVMNADGGDQKRALEPPVFFYGLSWSLDGRSLLFSSSYEDPDRFDREKMTGAIPPLSAFYSLDVASGLSRRLNRYPSFLYSSWSPDRSRVAFTLGNDIYVASSDGSGEKQLTTGSRSARPAWSPDGRRIAFISGPVRGDGGLSFEQSGVYVMAPDGTNKERVIALWASTVSWSPDGKRLLAVGSATEFALRDSDPRASQGRNAAAIAETFVMNDDGTNARVVPLGVQHSLDPVFSPDGRKIIFRSLDQGDRKIYDINLDGSGRRRLSAPEGDDTTFAVSPLLSPAR